MKQYMIIYVPIITCYLLFISYYPKYFKFFGNEYCQFLMVLSVLGCHLWKPEIAWIFGVLFVMTYKFYYDTKLIQESFTSTFTLPKEESEEEVNEDIKNTITEDESSVIHKIKTKFEDDYKTLLSDDIQKLENSQAYSYGLGVGLPEEVEEYDLEKTIDFSL